MKMTKKNGDIIFDYFLEPEQPYFGFNMPTIEGKKAIGDLFMVIDNEEKLL